MNIHWKDWCWSSNTLATWCKEPTHGKRSWCWERLRAGGKGMREDERLGWHHQLDGHGFEQTLGDHEGQRSLACCSPWGSQRVRHDLATKQESITLTTSPWHLGDYNNFNLLTGILSLRRRTGTPTRENVEKFNLMHKYAAWCSKAAKVQTGKV